MYAKLFASIYQGTLRGNTNGLVVFTNLLAHADASGWVDIHPKAIAEEVGLTQDQVRAALDELESPDAESRSPEEEGRRIVRLDEHRAWGWRIVNHGKYRAIRSEEDRREQNRLAQQRFREKNKTDNQQSKPRKPRSAQAEAEAEAEAEKKIADSPMRATPPPATKRLFELGSNFDLPTEWGMDAEALGWRPADVLKESERFRQYWSVGKGSGTRRSEKGWRQAWSNWLSKAERINR